MAIDADALKSLRTTKRLSQTSLAKAAGVQQQLISQLEAGTNTTTKFLPNIARALGVGVHVLDPEYAGEEEAIGVKLISWVSAGMLAQEDILDQDEVQYAPTVRAPGLDPRGDWIALRVDGDSMNLSSPPDSIIFVDRNDKKLVPGARYVIGDGNGGATYKMYEPPNTWVPHSTNKKHRPFVLPIDQTPDIIGRVRKTFTDM